MIIYPAIDLIDGRPVRLSQGRFDQVTQYDSEPADALVGYAKAGSEWAHVVDLDGAKAAEPRQHALIGAMAAKADIKVQAAGGVRSETHVQALLQAGVARVVIGSLAVDKPDLVKGWIAEFGPESIALALDIRMTRNQPSIAVRGWASDSGLGLWDVGGGFAEAGLRHMLITDIGKDGMMEGPNLELMQKAVARFPTVDVQASGGVRDTSDLRALKDAGAAGAIVGKALWEGAMQLKDALEAAQ